MDISKLKQPCDSSKTPLILFFNGTFAPIHDGHISMIVDAKQHLESKCNYEVLGVYLSPAHGNYCRRKLGEDYIVTEHRMQLCFLAADKYDWLMVDTWEMMQTEFCTFKVAMPNMYKRIRRYCSFLQDVDFCMGWLVGIDSYRPVEFKDIGNYLNICVSNRSGHENNVDKVLNSKLADRTIFVQSEHLDVSSTSIRKALRSGDTNDLTSFYKLFPQAVDYIGANHIWNHDDLKIASKECIKETCLFKSNITAETVTTMLRKCSYLKSAERVIKFDVNTFGETKGLSGTLWLLSSIEYDPECANKPSELVLKSSGRAGGYQQGLEQYFYSKCVLIDESMFIKSHGVFEYENRSVIVMDYYKNSICFDRDDGLSLPFVLFSIKHLARFHALYRKTSNLNLPSILDTNGAEWLKVRLRHVASILMTTMKSENKDMSQIDIPAVCLKRLETVIQKLQSSNYHSVCHNDCWLHNILFNAELVAEFDEKLSDKSFGELAFEIMHPRSTFSGFKLIDFEYVSYGSPLVDLAFLLYSSANFKHIQKHEMDIVSFYYTCITYYGVTDYTIDECIDDYYTARELTFMRLSSTMGRYYFKMGEFYNETKNFPLNINYLLQIILESYEQSVFYKVNSSKKNNNKCTI